MLALRLGIADLPPGLNRSDIVPAALVAGIGFTVSLFIAELSFDGQMLAEAKIGVLSASVTAALCGALALALVTRRTIAK